MPSRALVAELCARLRLAVTDSVRESVSGRARQRARYRAARRTESTERAWLGCMQPAEQHRRGRAGNELTSRILPHRGVGIHGDLHPRADLAVWPRDPYVRSIG